MGSDVSMIETLQPNNKEAREKKRHGHLNNVSSKKISDPPRSRASVKSLQASGQTCRLMPIGQGQTMNSSEATAQQAKGQPHLEASVWDLLAL